MSKKIRHVILWTLREELSDAEKDAIKKDIKAGLEGLVGKVPGLLEVNILIHGRIASSTADLMMDSVFESEEALKAYKDHPEHLKVADGVVRPNTAKRSCLDYEL